MKRNTVKRNVSLALGAVLVFGAVPAYAADAVTVNLNGSQMEFDVNPVIENSRTLVPFRKIFEALDWCRFLYEGEWRAGGYGKQRQSMDHSGNRQKRNHR